MGKVSIGLRGWRFEEEAVFDDDGEFRPLGEMPPDARQRVVRLRSLLGEPCDACFLIHGDSDLELCNVGRVVYGEPLGEVLLCDDHERDFLYWFREAGGRDLAGETGLADAFHEWFADGGRAPDAYGGLEHVERDPEGTPVGPNPDPAETAPGFEDERAPSADDPDALDVDLSDLNVDVDGDVDGD